MKLLVLTWTAAVGVAAVAQSASITHQITHEWSTNYLTYVPTVAVPGLPPFNPALGTLTSVGYQLAGVRRIDWEASAPVAGGTYYIAATAQFTLNAPELSGLPTLTLATFATPEQSASGYLNAGESVAGTLVSETNASGTVTTDLQRFTQTNQFFVLSNYGSDGGAVGYGGGAGFSTLVRYATATVTITYEYTPVTPPTLMIVPAGAGQATISWAPAPPGFVLQETLSLSPTNWMNSPSGSTNPIVVPASVPARFYRLFKP